MSTKIEKWWRYHNGVLVIADRHVHNLDQADQLGTGMLVFAERNQLIELADRVEDRSLIERAFIGLHTEGMDVIRQYKIPEAGQVDLWVPLNRGQGLVSELEKLASIRCASYQDLFPHEWFTLTGWELYRRDAARAYYLTGVEGR